MPVCGFFRRASVLACAGASEDACSTKNPKADRITPPARAPPSSVLLLFFEELGRVGPGLRRRIEPKDRQQGRVRAKGAVRLGPGQQTGIAALHLLPERSHVESQKRR